MSVTMRVLVVEDDEEIIPYLVDVFNDVNAEVIVAKSRDSAIELLDDRANLFDLLSLDLKIPPVDGSLDLDTQNGHAVLGKCRQAAPGLPIFILTGLGSDDFVSEFLRESSSCDIWGEGNARPTIDYLPKRRLDELLGRLKGIANAVNGLNEVEVVREPITLNLLPKDDRLLRIFVKDRGGARCDVSRISGGLSETRVFAVSVFDASGTRLIRTVVKTGLHPIINDETENYDQYITRLRHGATPRYIKTIQYGAMDTAGVFYSLASDFNETFFDVANDDAITPNLSTAISNLTAPWQDSAPERRLPIAQIRRALLPDEHATRLAAEYGLDWCREFENNHVQAKWCCTHGDLHGGNILVNRDSESATLIDYGDVANNPASLDPVTLEFCFLFHPDKPDLGNWPSIEQARRWWRLDEYIDGCPINSTVNFCRNWARDIAVGQREIAASAYAYFFRQLKYSDTNKELVIALLEGARGLYNET